MLTLSQKNTFQFWWVIEVFIIPIKTSFLANVLVLVLIETVKYNFNCVRKFFSIRFWSCNKHSGPVKIWATSPAVLSIFPWVRALTCLSVYRINTSTAGLVIRVWVWVQVVTLISLSKTLWLKLLHHLGLNGYLQWVPAGKKNEKQPLYPFKEVIQRKVMFWILKIK